MYTTRVYKPVMATDVVQFRFPQAEIEFIRSQGLNPNEFARERLEEALRALHAAARSRKILDLMKHAKIRTPIDPAALIREDRDSR